MIHPAIFLKPRCAIIAFAIAAFTLTARAHPGHSLDSESIGHVLTSPDHLLTLAGVGGVLLLAGFGVRKLIARRVLQVTGAAAMLLAAIIGAVQWAQ